MLSPVLEAGQVVRSRTREHSPGVTYRLEEGTYVTEIIKQTIYNYKPWYLLAPGGLSKPFIPSSPLSLTLEALLF